jgi:HD-GYP domain-containing protein (c-di-GMP phosphodiesterase class II)
MNLTEDRTPRTVSLLGSALSANIATLTARSIDRICEPHATASDKLDAAVEMLVDRVCLSLTLAKPIGITTWAARNVSNFGRAGVLDIVAAVSGAIAAAAAGTQVDRHRLGAFLAMLQADAERSAIDSEPPSQHAGIDAANALLAMLSEHDNTAAAHGKAVALWSRRLCAEMRVGAEATEFIALCALVHDVGMIAVPEPLLAKSGPLRASELALVREHAIAGERILSGIPDLQPCAVVIRSHHERYDGEGYPDGIGGTNIPFEARVIAVADSFHAMISERPYRAAIPPRTALEIVAEGRAAQWDPGVVDAMLGMFRHTRADAEAQASTA